MVSSKNSLSKSTGKKAKAGTAQKKKMMGSKK
eukprot:CAMPEP_0172405108 /NCGR_PEP_ID=MMETSP1061-20121228/65821_1 /TAXON_ID=37318 /ORGANISM="Pseudo-nitzschia pungens, Strain cf. pungens" /LENGTH=31 /DNA_ID= /DNA_START= /DNA_END= /DNA_ORIENTATION=